MAELAALFNELIRFEIELWNAVDARLRADCDLPLARLLPLQIIARRAACRVNDIADELSITVGGTSKVIDRIEASGLCVRRPNPQDRRSSIIELTPAGEQLLVEATAAFDDELQLRLGSTVPDRALRQFAATLSRLRAAGASVVPIERTL
ncbi:MAG: transcriptional regulator [Pseudonocardiales bacterium]|nr:transcriptional regulator [Pseudonocardiales bacterium]